MLMCEYYYSAWCCVTKDNSHLFVYLFASHNHNKLQSQ
jgi:hypothetical protein